MEDIRLFLIIPRAKTPTEAAKELEVPKPSGIGAWHPDEPAGHGGCDRTIPLPPEIDWASTWASHDGFHEKKGGETPVFGRSSNGGFWPKKLKKALSFNGG
jgi:hypothetical protein